MSYGLEIRNDSGNLAITDSTVNYHYIGSATPSAYLDTGVVPRVWYELTSPTKPMIFVEPTGTSRFTVVAVTNIGGNTWRVLLSYKSGTAPKIHGFAVLDTFTPAESNGFVVHKPDGKIAFDSSSKPLGLHLITSYNVSDGPTTYGGTPTELNTKEVNLGTLPTRAAFCYQNAGTLNSAFNTTFTGYTEFYCLLFRNGNNFGNTWSRSGTFVLPPGSSTFYYFWDETPKPLFVIDAARYD